MKTVIAFFVACTMFFAGNANADGYRGGHGGHDHGGSSWVLPAVLIGTVAVIAYGSRERLPEQQVRYVSPPQSQCRQTPSSGYDRYGQYQTFYIVECYDPYSGNWYRQ